ncbi:MAG: hypothetical protein LBG28_14755, partial [Tannerella sp.]|nr:hypothetical protein [Tannerella sp.]
MIVYLFCLFVNFQTGIHAFVTDPTKEMNMSGLVCLFTNRRESGGGGPPPPPGAKRGEEGDFNDLCG